MPDRVIVFDTTLRDGEQSAWDLFTERDKLDIAERLAAMRVDVIEAGFPAASAAERHNVASVARHVRTTGVCALAQETCNALETAVLIGPSSSTRAMCNGLRVGRLRKWAQKAAGAPPPDRGRG